MIFLRAINVVPKDCWSANYLILTSTPTMAPPPATVLVADDHPDTLLLLCLLLEGLGLKVLSAKDGREAVSHVQTSCPDIAFLDLSMPVVDGFDTIRELRRIFDGKVAVYALSAHCKEEELKEKALAMGADECLCKPIELDVIESRLSRHKLLPDARERV